MWAPMPRSAITVSVFVLPAPEITSSQAGSPPSCSTAAVASTASAESRSYSGPNHRRKASCTSSRVRSSGRGGGGSGGASGISCCSATGGRSGRTSAHRSSTPCPAAMKSSSPTFCSPSGSHRYSILAPLLPRYFASAPSAERTPGFRVTSPSKASTTRRPLRATSAHSGSAVLPPSGFVPRQQSTPEHLACLVPLRAADISEVPAGLAGHSRSPRPRRRWASRARSSAALAA